MLRGHKNIYQNQNKQVKVHNMALIMIQTKPKQKLCQKKFVTRNTSTAESNLFCSLDAVTCGWMAEHKVVAILFYFQTQIFCGLSRSPFRSPAAGDCSNREQTIVFQCERLRASGFSSVQRTDYFSLCLSSR
jgi:hypothetical protein